MNTTRDYRMKHNLCYSCGAPREDPTKTRCAACRKEQAAAAKAKARANRDRWNAEGKCPRCGRDRVPGCKLCARCQERAREDQKKRLRKQRKERQEAQLCQVCGGLLDSDSRSRCRSCLDKANGYSKARRERLSEEGYCVQCGLVPPVEGNQLCEECAAQQAVRRDAWFDKERPRRAANGECRDCRAPVAGESKFCMYHFTSKLVRNYRGRDEDAVLTSEDWEPIIQAMLEKWEEQNGLCFYTQRLLVPGTNASIDHVFPVRGHEEHRRSIPNLVWCDLDVNQFKRSMDPVEMLALAQQMVEREAAILQGTQRIAALLDLSF